MKKIKFNTSIPASLYDFSSEPNEKFSRAKLKMFYIGETPDHRLFTEKFSQELVKTLPYTPIVSQYDVEQGDFKGHAAEQNIYGIVDPLGQVSFEKAEDGKTWLICDVVLYTERTDMVGEIAKKIPGKSHSLEMDPNTVQYTVNYDNKMKIQNIEFIKGELIGASVLGDNQKPAFTGSTFFSQDSDFQHKMEILKDYCLSKQKEERGIDMEGTILNFIELSWGEKTKLVFDALEQRYGQYHVYPIDWFDSSVVAYIYYDQTDSTILTRIFYSFENEMVTLGDAEQVRIAYEAINKATEIVEEAQETVETAEEMSCGDDEEDKKEEENCETVIEDAECGGEDKEEEEKKEDMAVEETVAEEEKEEDDKKEEDKEDVKEEEMSLEPQTDNSVEDENSIENSTLLENEEQGANTTSNEETTNTSTFTDSERQEFEALKFEKKVNLLNSYKDSLPEDVITSFETQISDLSYDDLEASLAKEFRRVSLEQNSSKKSSVRTFSVLPRERKVTEQAYLSDLVNKYKTK